MGWAFNLGLGICGLFIAANWGSLIDAMFKKRSCSFAPPFLSGLLATLLIATHPDVGLRVFWWIPPMLDPSIAFALSVTAVVALVRRIRAFAGERKLK